MKKALFVIVAGVLLSIFAVPFLTIDHVRAQSGTNTQPPPPPPPPAGALGGPLVGLTSGQTTLFNNGYFTFNIKWDPIRGLGPVFTQAGCFNCHGGGKNVISQCQFNPPNVPCIAGGTSTLLGTRFGKFNNDGTFNFLDGNGTVPENEGGPTKHGQGVAQFDTLTGCSVVNIASSPTGATESGTTVTITTTVNHNFQVGQRVLVAGVGNSGYNGTFTIASIPSPTTLTFTNTVSSLAASGGGSINNMPHEVVPSDAAVANQLRAPELFGDGLIDAIPDSTISANSGVNKGMNITGVANMVPDQNGVLHVGRFGQKASIPNLEMFTAFAFFNEIGMTNLFFSNPLDPKGKHFPQGLPYPAACNDDPNFPINDTNGTNLIKTLQFNALLAPVTPGAPTAQTTAGQGVFDSIGCSLCHIDGSNGLAVMVTGANIKLPTDLNGGQTAVIAPLSSVAVNIYSDLLLHDMGSGLSGGIPFQPSGNPSGPGTATLTQWRTAPLWGLSTRIQVGLLHDNRTTNLDTAIRDHGGEAAQVITNYEALSPTDQANLLAFLSSL